jgi:RNA polymerase sigma-32 factor
VTTIATTLGVKDQDVVDMNRRLGGDTSLNLPVHEAGQATEWQDILVDDKPSPEAILVTLDETEQRHEALMRALGVLNHRERRIFEARRLAEEPTTLEDLAEEFHVSRERIRQIEIQAFEKVQTAAKRCIREKHAPVPAWA